MEKEKPNIKILVCCHTPAEWKSDEIYIPIHCGREISPCNLGIQGDNTGDNISEKNKKYCELTAMYWAWKNLKNVDYIGLCHYRRYFYFSENDVTKYLKNNEVVLVKPIIRPHSNLVSLQLAIGVEDVYIMIDCVKKIYPDCENVLIDYLYNSNCFIPYNMFFTSWLIFDKYQKWLYPILFELEKIIKFSNYTRQKRVIGYLSEALLPIYMLHNRYKIKYVKLENYNSNLFQVVQRYLRFNLIFKLSNPFKVKKIDIGEIKMWLKQDGINLDL